MKPLNLDKSMDVLNDSFKRIGRAMSKAANNFRISLSQPCREQILFIIPRNNYEFYNIYMIKLLILHVYHYDGIDLVHLCDANTFKVLDTEYLLFGINIKGNTSTYEKSIRLKLLHTLVNNYEEQMRDDNPHYDRIKKYILYKVEQDQLPVITRYMFDDTVSSEFSMPIHEYIQYVDVFTPTSNNPLFEMKRTRQNICEYLITNKDFKFSEVKVLFVTSRYSTLLMNFNDALGDASFNVNKIEEGVSRILENTPYTLCEISILNNNEASYHFYVMRLILEKEIAYERLNGGDVYRTFAGNVMTEYLVWGNINNKSFMTSRDSELFGLVCGNSHKVITLCENKYKPYIYSTYGYYIDYRLLDGKHTAFPEIPEFLNNDDMEEIDDE